MQPFDLSASERKKLWEELLPLLENYYTLIESQRVAPELLHDKIIQLAQKYDFEKAVDTGEAIRHVIRGLKEYGVQVSHPGYYGLYNPRPNFASILADLITAAMNPQLAAWSHSPFAVETERFLIQKFGEKFGLPGNSIDGAFCNGGAEANHTAVLCAINRAYPDYARDGLVKNNRRLIIYSSAEAHHSIGKAAMNTGLGKNAVHTIAVDRDQKMRIGLLEKEIRDDLQKGDIPIMLVATAGTTGSGAIDPIGDLQKVAEKYSIWFHVDAAYGGAAILDPELKHFLKGISMADSVSFDMHKWMSVPMGTSIFLTSDKNILAKSFGIRTQYMPREADNLDVVDPYLHSMQWSRRFIGLRIYLSLLFFGWEGYVKTIRHQAAMGDFLRKSLNEQGWKVMNNTPLPVVCFTDPSFESQDDFANTLCDSMVASGKTWVSVYRVNGCNTLRACITNYATTSHDIARLVELANEQRSIFVSSDKKSK
ncbi:MAG: aminotransferase class V-fold PLP-dependent enzyme [bacterium]